MTPAFAAAMASWLAKPARAAAVEHRTIDPPEAIIALAPMRTVWKAVVRLVSMV